MQTFNSNKFIKSLKENYDAIPYIQGDGAAKVMVADSIKSNGFQPEDAYSFISKEMGLSSTLSEGEPERVQGISQRQAQLSGDVQPCCCLLWYQPCSPYPGAVPEQD